MGRISRGWLLYNGCYAHVFTRAIEKRKIFQEDEDFYFFKRRIAAIKMEYQFKVYHYCLMQTHFHLIVKIEDIGRFSEGIKVVKKDYAHRYNKKHRRFGAVWRDRYKSKIIEDEAYLNACGRYVENNPVEAGMVEQASDWPHSSSRHYELGSTDEIIDQYDMSRTDPHLSIDGKAFEKQRAIGSDWFQYRIIKKLKG